MQPEVAVVLPRDPDQHPRALLPHERGDRRAFLGIVRTQPKDVVAGNRQRVRGAALADHQNALSIGDRLHRTDFSARLRADHDAHAVLRQLLQPGRGSVRHQLGIDDFDVDPQTAVEAGEVGIHIGRRQGERSLAGLPER